MGSTLRRLVFLRPPQTANAAEWIGGVAFRTLKRCKTTATA